MANVSINGKFKAGGPSESIVPVIGTVEYLVLDESTSPAAIARDQRRDVMDAYHKGQTNAEMISEFLWLELWVVRRRMHELGIGPAAVEKMKSRPSSHADKAIPRIVELLLGGPRRSSEIAKAIGIPVQSCLSVLRTATDRFVSESVGVPPKARLLWRLRGPVQDTRPAEERVAGVGSAQVSVAGCKAPSGSKPRRS